MPTQISQQWPDEIAIDVVTPLTVLRALASSLEQKTKGILQAEISTFYPKEDLVQHSFEIVAPAVAYYRHQLLIAEHHRELVYPVTLTGYFLYNPMLGNTVYTRGTKLVSTQQELDRALGETIRSPSTLAVIQSLIARSREAAQTESGNATQNK